MLPEDAPPPAGAAAGGATRTGLPTIRDLGSCAAAPRNPWSSAPPTAADIAGARKKRLDGGAAAEWRVSERGIFVRCGRALRTAEGS